MANLLDRLLGPTPKRAPAKDVPWDQREVDERETIGGEPHQTGEQGQPAEITWEDQTLRWRDQLPATEESIVHRRDVFDERTVIAEPTPGSQVLDTIPHPIVSAEHTPLHHDGLVLRGTLHGEAEQFTLVAGAAPVRILGEQYTRDSASIVNQGTADAWIGFHDSISSTSASFKVPAGGAYVTKCVKNLWALAVNAGAVLHVIQEHNG